MSNLITFIHQFDDAWNAHDTEAVLRIFAADAVVRLSPPLPDIPQESRGREEIGALVRALLPGFSVNSSNFETSEDRVQWKAIVSNDLFRQQGLESAVAVCEAVVRNNKVELFAPTFTPATVARLVAAGNRATTYRLYEALDENVDEAFAAYISEDVTMYFAGMPEPMNYEEARMMVHGFYNAFPDLRHHVEDVITDGDRVCVRIRVTGTQHGEFQGIPPTGRSFEIESLSLDRYESGKPVEHRVVVDMLSLLQQIGAIPAPAAV